jgi:hypothetical protein
MGRGRGLYLLFSEKDAFTLLRLGTLVFFDPHDKEIEETEGVKIPQILWSQLRAQPPRFVGGTYKDDLTQDHHERTRISPYRFLYFSLVNLLAYLCADRNENSSKMIRITIPHHIVKSQLITEEVLNNAGNLFVPNGPLREAKRKEPEVESRDLGDLSDLASMSSHSALVLHGFLGQSPFADEEKRSTIIKQVYIDGSRADDDDTVFEEQGPFLALNEGNLRSLCHMCSWQMSALADLCRDMAGLHTLAGLKEFTDCMSTLVSVLSKMLSKLIGLGYFERFKREITLAG